MTQYMNIYMYSTDIHQLLPSSLYHHKFDMSPNRRHGRFFLAQNTNKETMQNETGKKCSINTSTTSRNITNGISVITIRGCIALTISVQSKQKNNKKKRNKNRPRNNNARIFRVLQYFTGYFPKIDSTRIFF